MADSQALRVTGSPSVVLYVPPNHYYLTVVTYDHIFPVAKSFAVTTGKTSNGQIRPYVRSSKVLLTLSAGL